MGSSSSTSTPPLELSLTGARWSLPAVEDQAVRQVLDATELGPVAARVLALRGGDPARARPPRLDDLHDPLAMLNMGQAVQRLQRAVRDRERVRIITDYDVDGTTSSLILQATLQRAGHQDILDYHIPDRMDEGYGFSTAAAHRAVGDGVQLIVTADIGVRDHAAVDIAHEAGVDVLICDHHLPPGASVPPQAMVLCPPQQGCDYPNPHLAACGVTLKLAQALLADDPLYERVLFSLLKLAAVGTVADMVTLAAPENRAIVTLGLQELNRGPHHPGLAALLSVSKLSLGQITVRDLGFRIGPRINAAGRVDSASRVVELLTCRDPDEARRMATELDQLNTQRRDIQRHLTREALARLPESPPPFAVISGPEDEGWHRGVVGIVASRIKDELYRPAAVVSIQGEVGVGSLRSIPAVHAVKALDAAADLLVRYGGHPAAAGFTVRTQDLDALQQRLSAWVLEHTPPDRLVRTRSVDVEVSAEQLDADLLAELERLGPFGMGNPQPRLLVRDVTFQRVDVRASGRLLRLLVPRPGRGAIPAIWWGQGHRADDLRQGSYDLLGRLSLDRWQGQRRVQLELLDMRPAG